MSQKYCTARDTILVGQVVVGNHVMCWDACRLKSADCLQL